MIQMQKGVINFESVRDSGPNLQIAYPTIFTGPVRHACCVLTGIDYGYTNDDHHLWRTTITLECHCDRDVVTVEGRFGLRDSSGYFDDPYDATIHFCVIADVDEPPTGFLSRRSYYLPGEIVQR